MDNLLLNVIEVSLAHKNSMGITVSSQTMKFTVMLPPRYKRTLPFSDTESMVKVCSQHPRPEHPCPDRPFKQTPAPIEPPDPFE